MHTKKITDFQRRGAGGISVSWLCAEQRRQVGRPDGEMPRSGSLPDSVVPLGLPDITSISGFVGGTKGDVIAVIGKDEDYLADDGFTYIGRVYETQLCGEPVMIYTDCGRDNRIDTLIIGITDGDSGTGVPDAVIQRWQKQISGDSGVAMQEQPVSPASDMQYWNWRTEDTVYELRLLDHVLTLSVTTAVRELYQ